MFGEKGIWIEVRRGKVMVWKRVGEVVIRVSEGMQRKMAMRSILYE